MVVWSHGVGSEKSDKLTTMSSIDSTAESCSVTTGIVSSIVPGANVIMPLAFRKSTPPAQNKFLF